MMVVYLSASTLGQRRIVCNVCKGHSFPLFLLPEEGAFELEGASHQLLGKAIVLAIGQGTARAVPNIWRAYALGLHCFEPVKPLLRITPGRMVLQLLNCTCLLNGAQFSFDASPEKALGSDESSQGRSRTH